MGSESYGPHIPLDGPSLKYFKQIFPPLTQKLRLLQNSIALYIERLKKYLYKFVFNLFNLFTNALIVCYSQTKL